MTCEMTPKFLVVPDVAVEEIEALLSLDPAQIGALAGLLADKETIRRGTFKSITSKLGIGQDMALKVLSAVRNLRTQQERFNLDNEQLTSDLKALGSAGVDFSKETIEALVALLRKSDDDYFVEKATQLRHGLVPHLLDAVTLVDARPVFSKDRTDVQGMLLLTYLELTVHSRDELDEQTHVVQLTRADITTLKQKLDDAEAKLDRLSTRLQEKFEVFE